MSRVLSRAKQTQKNWWDAFKVSCNIHGYNYYDIPGNLRYRYPAPGSCPLDKTSHPHLFKNHWKTPFRDSHLNVRMKEKSISWEDQAEYGISELPNLDPSKERDAALLKEQQPDLSKVKLANEHKDYGSEEALAEIRAELERRPQMVKDDMINRSAYIGDIGMDYN